MTLNSLRRDFRLVWQRDNPGATLSSGKLLAPRVLDLHPLTEALTAVISHGRIVVVSVANSRFKTFGGRPWSWARENARAKCTCRMDETPPGVIAFFLGRRIGLEKAQPKEYLADIWLTCSDFLPTTPS